MRRSALVAGMTIAQALATAVLTLVCALAFWSVVPLALGLRSDVIMSGSMAPGIRPGDVVVSSPAPVSGLRPGTIILFVDPARPQRTLLHRYIARDAAGRLVTKGDANAEPDSTAVPPDLLYGQGRVRIPFAGLPAYWSATGQRARLTGGALMLVILLVIATPRPPTAATVAARPRTGVLPADRHRPKAWQARHRAVRRSSPVPPVDGAPTTGGPRHAPPRKRHAAGRRRAGRAHASVNARQPSSARRPAASAPAGRRLPPAGTRTTPVAAPRRADAGGHRRVGDRDGM
jgi:signal peptidase I